MTIRNVTITRFTLLSMMALCAAGCGGSNSTAARVGEKATSAKEDHDTKTAIKDGDHSGWWCTEHGVPEGVCSQCSAKVAADFQKKGDWCAEHERAKSQCFLCDPALKEKFAAQYQAKEGKEPPVLEEEKEEEAEKKS